MHVQRKTFPASDGTPISYLDIGEGMPFVWIHGWGGNAGRQQPLLESLSKRGLRCLCFDQRGCGETPMTGELGVVQSARDANELLRHLGIDDAVMLGYSLGAAVLLSYVELFGTQYLSRVIIGDMSPKPLNDETWKLGLYQGWYTEAQLEADLLSMERDYKKFAILFAEQTIFPHTPQEPRNFEVTPEFVQAIYDRAEREGKAEMLGHFMEVEADNAYANRIYWETCDRNDYRPALGKIDVPTALLYADPGSIYDPHTAYWMATKIQDVKLYPFEGCTHMANAEKPEAFIEAIVDFAMGGKAKHSAKTQKTKGA